MEFKTGSNEQKIGELCQGLYRFRIRKSYYGTKVLLQYQEISSDVIRNCLSEIDLKVKISLRNIYLSDIIIINKNTF